MDHSSSSSISTTLDDDRSESISISSDSMSSSAASDKTNEQPPLSAIFHPTSNHNKKLPWKHYKLQLFFSVVNAYLFLPLVFLWMPSAIFGIMSRFSFQLRLYQVAKKYSDRARSINFACLILGRLADYFFGLCHYVV